MIHETWKNIKQHQDYKLRRLYLGKVLKYREIVGVYQMRCDFRTIETPLCSIQRVWERVWREKNESWLDFFFVSMLASATLRSLNLTYCIIINDTNQKSHFKNQRYNIKARRWSDTLTTNLQLLLFTFFAFVIKRVLIQFFLCDIAGFTNGRKVQKTISDTEGTGNCIIDQGMETIGQCRQGYHPIFQNLHCVSHFFLFKLFSIMIEAVHKRCR